MKWAMMENDAKGHYLLLGFQEKNLWDDGLVL